MCCAFAVRFLHFDAQPVVVQTPEPMMKILIAKRAIPSGAEITADFVVFQEVALSEVPPGALTTFAQTYRRQPAYPIPAGCPICEDLLVPFSDTASHATFIPTGSEFVTLGIVHIRQGDKVFSPKKPLSAILTADQHIDIRVVPHETQGRLSDMRNEVLRASGAQDFRSTGELVLENVPIHRIRSQPAAEESDSVQDSLTLLLDKSEASKIAAASKRGRIRIFVHRVAEKQDNIEDAFEVATQEETSSQTLLVSLPTEQSSPLDIPPTLGQQSTIPVASSQSTAPGHTDEPNLTTLSTASIPELATRLPVTNENNTVQGRDPIDLFPSNPVSGNPIAHVLPGSEPDENVSIRNDATVSLSHGSQPSRTSPLEPERSGGPPPASAEVLSASEPGADALARPTSEAVLGTPRITGTIQFLPVDRVISAKEPTQEPLRRMPPSIPPPPPREIFPQMPAPAPLPMVISQPMSQPVVMREQTRTPAYSPFERRIYTVQSSEDSEEIPSPPRLLKN